jgi:hypothetical protein
MHEIFTTIEGKKVDQIRINSFLQFGNHDVTVVFHYAFLNRIVFYLMPIDLYEKCKHHYADQDLYKVIFHMSVEPTDIIEAEQVNAPF